MHGFCWVTPWAVEAVTKFQYIELDCTFSILKPYITLIPQIIVNGLSLPLGFLVGPQENNTIYKCFYDELTQIIGSNAQLKLLPVLSDHGTGIEKFCKDYELKQYLCIRHILNIIGPNSFCGKLASKLLMSQTEEQFSKNYKDIIEIANNYYHNLKSSKEKVIINNNFLNHCLLKLDEDNHIVPKEIDQNLYEKIVLSQRGFIAAASNHAEGFHSKLKIISKENNGFIYNLKKIIEIINKRFEKYVSGLSAEKQCERIKKNLLDKQKKYNIKPLDKCNCDSNYHQKLILNSNIPCMHTVRESSIISMKYPILNVSNFVNKNIFLVSPSKLEGIVSTINRGRNVKSSEEQFSIGIDRLETILKTNRAFLNYYKPNNSDEESENSFRRIIIEALNLGLPNNKIDDFYKFLSMDYIAHGYDLQKFMDNKNANIGRYFAINQID